METINVSYVPNIQKFRPLVKKKNEIKLDTKTPGHQGKAQVLKVTE